MIRALYFVLLFALFISSQTEPINSEAQCFSAFKINNTRNARGCAYTVSIRTSCFSPRYTRDQISLSFGDAYGYQVYAPRLDNPYTRTFERCSADTFQVHGPCTYQICYLYLYRRGYDGWIPESVEVYGYNTRPAMFYFNTRIPRDTWYGFNYCRGHYGGASAST